MKAKPIYVEIRINSSINEAWEHTQQPHLHEQWDLRFSSITYETKINEQDSQRFTYKTKILPHLFISGWGESKGTHEKNGVKTSALHFGTKQFISPIKEGKGYWKYVPNDNGLTFLTQYDYKPRFGKGIDALFRPLIGWATALSFDVLARWLETGEPPKTQYRRFFSYYLAIAMFIVIWMYQGIVPKLVGQHPLEVEMLTKLAPFLDNQAATILTVVGLLEVVIACLFLVPKFHKALLYGQIALFPVLTISAMMAVPHVATDPFNVITLNGSLWIVSIIACLLKVALPTASSCKRKRGESSDL